MVHTSKYKVHVKDSVYFTYLTIFYLILKSSDNDLSGRKVRAEQYAVPERS